MSKKTILSNRGYSVAKECMSEAEQEKHRRNCQIIPFVEREEFGAVSEPIKLYTETEKRMYFPRFYGTKNFGKPETDKLNDPDSPIEPMSADITCSINLRPKQVVPVETIMKQLQNVGDNGGGAIMSVPCGFGKTCCALKMAFDLGVRTAIVCHTTDLMLQWAERIDDFFKGARIGIVQQSKCEIEDKDFVICSLKTLALKDFPKNTFRSIGLAVWDEVHLMATNLFSNGFPKLTTRFSIGLSATPFRKDKCEIIFQHFIGPISVYLKRPKNERTEVNCLHYTNDKVVIKYNKWGKINYTSTTVLLCANEKRNEMIKGILIDLANDGRTILVLSEYIKHLKTLHSKLTQFLNEHPEFNFTVGLYIGAMNNDERKVSQECDIILGTYKLASVGMDIPALNTLVLASPRKEIEQSVGRILRKEQGFHPLIIDVIDDCSLFKSQSRIRKNFYREYGYTIMLIKLDVNGKEISRRKGAKNTKRKAKRGEVDVDKLDLDKLNRADPSLLDFSNFVIRK